MVSHPELIDLYPTLREAIAPGREVEGLEGTAFGRSCGRAADPMAVEAFGSAFTEAGHHPERNGKNEVTADSTGHLVPGTSSPSPAYPSTCPLVP